jgi:DUF177 domain-containing protein
VGKENKYQIVYQGLSEGKHEFDFDINDSFFENREYSEIKKGELKAKIIFNKKSTFLELDVKVDGFVELICDRCLGEYKQKIKFKGKLYVKFSESEGDLDYDVICLSSKDHDLDLSHYLYESIRLSIPLKRVHPYKMGKSMCDPEMINNIYNLNTEESTEDEIDPRWNELKNLMDNNNK